MNENNFNNQQNKIVMEPIAEKKMGKRFEPFLSKPLPTAENNFYNAPVVEKIGEVGQNVPIVQGLTFSAPTEEQTERKKIKRAANFVGFSFLVMQAVIYTLNLVPLFVLAGIFGSEKAYEILNEPAILELQQILFASTVFTLPFIFVFRLGGYKISNLISFSRPKKHTFLPFFLIGIGLCTFSNLASSYTAQFFEQIGFHYEVDFGESPKGFFGMALSFIATVVVAPLVEEFACRGIILGSLKKYDEKVAILFSALLFGLMHENFEQMPFAACIGLILGFVTVKAGSIWPAIAIHAANNFVSFAMKMLLVNLSEVTQNIIYLFYLMLSLLAGIFGILIYTKEGNSITLEKSTTKNTFGIRFGTAFSSVPVIIYSVLCILSSLKYFVL